MNINREFISTNNINGTDNPCKYIVIHETDNERKGANARAHAKAQHNGDFADMSVHYYCGLDGIYQAAEHTCKCWHVGRQYVAAPNVPCCSNNNSIGVEICVNSDGDYSVAREHAIELVKHLLAVTGISPDRVIRHFDAKGKYCPRNMLDTPSLWQDFKSRIGEPENSAGEGTDSEQARWRAIGTATCRGEGVRVRSTPGFEENVIRKLGRGNRFELDGITKNGFHHIKVENQIGWLYSDYVLED